MKVCPVVVKKNCRPSGSRNSQPVTLAGLASSGSPRSRHQRRPRSAVKSRPSGGKNAPWLIAATTSTAQKKLADHRIGVRGYPEMGRPESPASCRTGPDLDVVGVEAAGNVFI